MDINKHNYEAFFLDYHEGNLTPQQVADLLLFVEQHPELKEEFESFENLTLEDLSAISFEGKSSLKKEITTGNREEYFIRAVEDTLVPSEKKLLDLFIEQHPQFLTELELFQKTKLSADTSIVFENKEALKRTVVTTDDLLIASVEGLLTKQENAFLEKQLAVDAEMQHSYGLYKQTRFTADLSVVYEAKEELKRKERKIIPFFYYVAAAASIALLIGLFFLYNNGETTGSDFADKTNITKTAPVENKVNGHELTPTVPVLVKEFSTSNQTAARVKNKNIAAPEKKEEHSPVILDEQPIHLAENKKQVPIEEAPKDEVIVKNEEPKVKKEEAPALAKVENQQPTANTQQPGTATGFLSLKEVVAEKIKEKTLDDATLALQKKTGRSKRLTGWDLAQIVTKGISKVTGRNLEVKPTYNEEGDVTAYALGNGLQVSRGK